MGMTLADVRRQVRDYMQLAEEDLPDGQVDAWVASGLRWLAEKGEWSWDLRVAEVSVPAGSGVTAEGAVLARCRRLVDVIAPGQGTVPSLEVGEAVRRWPGGGDSAGDRVAGFTVTGDAAGGGVLRLWPGASAARRVVVRYYEWPVSWPVSGSTAPVEVLPVPEIAHEAVYRWVLAEASLREGAFGDAGVQRALFHQQVDLLLGSAPLVVGGFRVGSDRRV